MQLSDFDYVLPRELIAQYPLPRRDACRLLVLDRKTKEIAHRTFADIGDYFNKTDTLVFNNSKVLPARLIGKKATGGKVDCLLLEKKSPSDFSVLLKPSDTTPGTNIYFANGSLKATVIDKRVLRFNTSDADYIYSKGIMPLPPYIKRLPEATDKKRYQTVYCKIAGSVAAPTAGLHFTKKLLWAIRRKGVNFAYVTLHINYATFNPVRENDISRHRMYKEYYQINKHQLRSLKEAKARLQRVICVGTTCARVLEELAELNIDDTARGRVYAGYTDLFIYSGYKFKMVDCLLTNFHLPRSTLLMLVCAFAGRDNIMRAYSEAIRKRYRFYSYGDAMLIL